MCSVSSSVRSSLSSLLYFLRSTSASCLRSSSFIPFRMNASPSSHLRFPRSLPQFLFACAFFSFFFSAFFFAFFSAFRSRFLRLCLSFWRLLCLRLLSFLFLCLLLCSFPQFHHNELHTQAALNFMQTNRATIAAQFSSCVEQFVPVWIVDRRPYASQSAPNRQNEFGCPFSWAEFAVFEFITFDCIHWIPFHLIWVYYTALDFINVICHRPPLSLMNWISCHSIPFLLNFLFMSFRSVSSNLIAVHLFLFNRFQWFKQLFRILMILIQTERDAMEFNRMHAVGYGRMKWIWMS